MWRTRSQHWKDLTQAGDVEANPGPAVPFHEFASSFAGDFLGCVDKSTLARGLVDLKARASKWNCSWTTALFESIPTLTLPDAEALTVVAAYEIYSDAILQWTQQGPEWVPNPSEKSEVEALREQIRRMELTMKPPTEEELLGCLSPDTVARFKTLTGLAQWTTDALEVFETCLTSISEDEAMRQMWDVTVRAHFQHTLHDGATSSSASQRGHTGQ